MEKIKNIFEISTDSMHTSNSRFFGNPKIRNASFLFIPKSITLPTDRSVKALYYRNQRLCRYGSCGLLTGSNRASFHSGWLGSNRASDKAFFGMRKNVRILCCGAGVFGSPPSPLLPVPHSRLKLCSLKLTTTHMTSALWHIVGAVVLAQSTLKV
jgi:hypothetical protein